MFQKNRNTNWLTSRPIAHRGLHTAPNIPENSLLAFEKAIEAGHPIELDIRLTADKQIVVFHDETLERMCGDRQQISTLTFRQLSSFKLLNTEQQIPLLQDVLTFIDGRVPILIELKVKNYTGLMEYLLFHLLQNYSGDFALQSFHPISIRHLKKLNPNFHCGLLAGSYECYGGLTGLSFILKNLFLVPYLRPDFISYEYQALSDPAISLFRKFSHIPIITWTIDNEEKREKLSQLCNNFIFEQITI